MEKRRMEGLTELTMFVNKEPVQNTRIWQDPNDPQGKPFPIVDEIVRGIWMTKTFSLDNKLATELYFRTKSVKSVFGSDIPSFADFMKIFYRNEDALLAGKKLIKFDIANMPRRNKKGDKTGLITSFSPVVVGFTLVDADLEDRLYIETIKEFDGEQTPEEALENADKIQAEFATA